jgi:hypothetical protein
MEPKGDAIGTNQAHISTCNNAPTCIRSSQVQGKRRLVDHRIMEKRLIMNYMNISSTIHQPLGFAGGTRLTQENASKLCRYSGSDQSSTCCMTFQLFQQVGQAALQILLGNPSTSPTVRFPDILFVLSGQRSARGFTVYIRTLCVLDCTCHQIGCRAHQLFETYLLRYLRD